ncbi:MAG: hypothetical protein KF712_16510 [Akkermansiaceae bacterium]|nr:hypothetical protein [Akkermansiaceae bacterium]
MTPLPPSPDEALKIVPPLIQASLVQCIRTAYSITEQIAADFPILNGPLEATILGQIRYGLVNNVVAKSVEDGLVMGGANWHPIANGSGFFMEYAFGIARITFASSHAMYKCPKKSNFRLSRANENQLSLFPSDVSDKSDEGPALLMLHGYKSLNFAQLMVPGDRDGTIVGLAWSPNIISPGAEGEGFGDDPTTCPVDPIPAEPLAEIALRLRSTEIEKLKNSEH